MGKEKLKNLVAASFNEGKIREIKEILGLSELSGLKDLGILVDIEETGATFEENAVIKAKAAFELLQRPVISDDSGLEVFALGGRPGIYSARYACHGDDSANNLKLLDELKGVDDRRARFVCVAALINQDGKLFISRGETEGEILDSLKGGDGFGYDPLFYSYELKKTFGQASIDEKNRVSHRFRAIRGLIQEFAK